MTIGEVFGSTVFQVIESQLLDPGTTFAFLSTAAIVVSPDIHKRIIDAIDAGQSLSFLPTLEVQGIIRRALFPQIGLMPGTITEITMQRAEPEIDFEFSAN